MLTLNQDVFMIVDQDGVVEYDYDGPMLEYSEEGKVKYLTDCLEYLKHINSKNKNYRIVKVRLIEVLHGF